MQISEMNTLKYLITVKVCHFSSQSQT